MISVILFKMGKHSDFHLSFFQIVGAWRNFTAATKLINSFIFISFVATVKSRHARTKKEAEMKIAMFEFIWFIWFGGRCLKIREVGMDFEPYFKVHSLVCENNAKFIT